MDGLTGWLSYWGEVFATSFTWALTIWPFPTVLLGCLVTVLTMAIHWKLGQREEVRNIGISLGVGIGASVIAFLLFVVLIGPFLHTEGINQKLMDLEQLRTDKKNLSTALEEYKSQRDEAIKQRDLFEEARDYVQTKLDNTQRELNTARKQLDDKKASIAEKARRKAIHEQLENFYMEGQLLRRRGFFKVQEPAPLKEADDWATRTSMYLKNETSLADAAEFDIPPMGKKNRFNIPPDHETLVNVLDLRLGVLKAVIGRFTPGSKDSDS